MRPTTLRTRTTLLAATVTALTLVAGSVVLVVTLRERLTVGNDGAARARVADLLLLAERGGLPETVRLTNDEGVAQVVAADGSVLAASVNAGRDQPMADLDAGPEPEVHTVTARDDDEIETYRVWAATGPSPDGEVTVYVGTSLESVNEATRALQGTLAVGVPLALALLVLALWWVLGGALRRMDRIRAEVDEITGERLDRRVPEGTADDEVARLARTMNGMLARLEESQARQRAFVADASHDLQSPLAGQRAQLEVALAHPERTDATSLARDLLDSTQELEVLVRDLLTLASVDAGAPSPVALPLDLDDVVLEEAARARTGGVAIDTSGVSAAPVLAVRADVQRIVRNLLDNAVAHAAATVTLTVTAGATLDVVDDGPGVPTADREKVFERFHRGDSARPRHGSGSGLGLAIARGLAERLGGSLVVVDREHGAHFRLRLPPVP